MLIIIIIEIIPCKIVLLLTFVTIKSKTPCDENKKL